MPFVSTIPTYYMVFLRHSKQILHVLPLNNLKAIISYLCQCFIAHEEVCGVYLSILLGNFHQWTSGFIRLSNNFAKRAGNGIPSPKLINENRHSSMVCDCWTAPEGFG